MQLTCPFPTNLADVNLRVHSTYNWSVPGYSVDLEGELAIAMDTLTPAEVGRALGKCARALYRPLFLREITPQSSPVAP